MKKTRIKADEILVVDTGGTNIKIYGGGRKVPHKIPSGPTLTARGMAAAVKRLSPVIMIVLIPMARIRSNRSRIPGLTISLR